MKESGEIYYSPVTEVAGLQSAVELQKTAWPQETITSMPQMRAAVCNGGSVIGAFADERLVGFNYGFAGYDGRQTHLVSHMMAIHPDYRNGGIGMRLKLEQRLWAMRYGYRTIVWTYDPFEARNGYLNLSKLGGTVSQFLPSFYGEDPFGQPVDRFLVEWELQSERVEKALNKQSDAAADLSVCPALLALHTDGTRIAGIHRTNVRVDDLSCCSIPIPQDALRLKQEQPQLFADWHRHLRELVSEALSLRFHVVSLIRTEGSVHHYVLEVKR